METQNYAVERRFTALEKLWQKLGFGSAFVDADDDRPGFAPGYITSEITTVWDFRDRLRILLSGKSRMMIRIYTDVPVKVAQTDVATGVLPPGSRFFKGS